MRAQKRRRHSDRVVLNVPGLKLWVRAESLRNLADNAPVEVWTDESGNGNDLEQAVPGSRPVFLEDADGLPAVSFDGLDDVLATAGDVLNTDRHTIFLVARPLATGSKDAVGTGGSGNGDLVLMVPASYHLRGVMWRGAQSNQTDGAALIHSNAFALFELETTETDLFLRLNGVLDGARALSGSPAGVTKPVFLGSRNSSLYFQGYVRALLVFEGNPGTQEKERIREFLMSAYQIAVPYPPPPVPGAPQDFSGQDNGGGEVYLSWSDVPYATGVKVERKLASEPDTAFAVVGEVGEGETEYYDQGVGPDAVSYRVRAFNVSGYSPYSGTVTVTF